MLEQVRLWSPLPALRDAVIEEPGLRIRSHAGLDQWLVSGDLEAACRRAGAGMEAVGALGVATGSRYAVRIARERILLVGEQALPFEPGWSENGYLATGFSAGLHVFELEGERVRDLVRRACVIDPQAPGPSAAIAFAGVDAVLYAVRRPEVLRLHVDRALAPYVWGWFQTTCTLIRERGIAPLC